MVTLSFKDVVNSSIIERYVPELLKNLLIKHNGWIIGGMITSVFSKKKINDIDIYFENDEDRVKFTKALNVHIASEHDKNENMGRLYELSKKKAILMFSTELADSYIFCKEKMQVIKLFTGSPSTIFDSFDFTINMGAYSFKSNEFVVSDTFFKHLAARKLVINIGTSFPINTVIRVFKYVRKGYTISGIEFIKVLLKVHSLNLTNYKELSRQLQGIDTLFLKPLTDHFKKEEVAEQEYNFNTFIKLYDELVIYQDDINNQNDE